MASSRENYAIWAIIITVVSHTPAFRRLSQILKVSVFCSRWQSRSLRPVFGISLSWPHSYHIFICILLPSQLQHSPPTLSGTNSSNTFLVPSSSGFLSKCHTTSISICSLPLCRTNQPLTSTLYNLLFSQPDIAHHVLHLSVRYSEPYSEMTFKLTFFEKG